jgi:DNA invertase Pin-like site-specific DNA recombinase
MGFQQENAAPAFLTKMTVSVKDEFTRSLHGQEARAAAATVRPFGEVQPRSLIGYARVSTDEQNLGLQQDALQTAGCHRVYEDHGLSGTSRSRPGLDAALAGLRSGDVLVVWRLDRLGRSLSHLIGLIDDLAARGIGFRSLTESFDTVSSGGRLVFHVMAALAEFERSLIAERTRAGLAAARVRGRRLGRPPLHTAAQRRAAVLSVRRGRPVQEAARLHGMHPRTLYRIIRAAGSDA